MYGWMIESTDRESIEEILQQRQSKVLTKNTKFKSSSNTEVTANYMMRFRIIFIIIIDIFASNTKSIGDSKNITLINSGFDREAVKTYNQLIRRLFKIDAAREESFCWYFIGLLGSWVDFCFDSWILSGLSGILRKIRRRLCWSDVFPSFQFFFPDMYSYAVLGRSYNDVTRYSKCIHCKIQNVDVGLSKSDDDKCWNCH